MAKKRICDPPETRICYVCGMGIYGDHVVIQTKCGKKMYLHYKCMPGGSKTE